MLHLPLMVQYLFFSSLLSPSSSFFDGILNFSMQFYYWSMIDSSPLQMQVCRFCRCWRVPGGYDHRLLRRALMQWAPICNLYSCIVTRFFSPANAPSGARLMDGWIEYFNRAAWRWRSRDRANGFNLDKGNIGNWLMDCIQSYAGFCICIYLFHWVRQ